MNRKMWYRVWDIIEDLIRSGTLTHFGENNNIGRDRSGCRDQGWSHEHMCHRGQG